MSTLLRLRPLRDPPLRSTMETRVPGLRPRVTRVAPCSGSRPCLSPLLNPNTTRPLTTAPRLTHTSTTRLSGTSTVRTVVAVTAHSDTRRTSCPPDMDLRLSPSSCHDLYYAGLNLAVGPLQKIHIRPSIHLSDSSVQKFLSISPLYLGSTQPQSRAHLMWLLDTWLVYFSLHQSIVLPTWTFRTEAHNRPLLFAICTHIGATPDLTKTHKACDHHA
jgi:hypothetical protein